MPVAVATASRTLSTRHILKKETTAAKIDVGFLVKGAA